MKLYRIALLALILALLCATAFSEGAAPAQVDLPAPDFEVQTLDGEAFRLSEQAGKVIYLNIWATWCPPCVAETPDIQKLAEAHPDDLIVLGVSLDASETTVQEFLTANGLTYPVAMDWDYAISTKLYPTMYIPESVFIDPNGVVSSIGVGGLTYEQMERQFQDALARAAQE